MTISAETIEELTLEENPKADKVRVKVFSNALALYLEAEANIAKNGAVVQHPRTGTPFENPYLKVLERQGAILAKTKGLVTQRVMHFVESMKNEPET